MYYYLIIKYDCLYCWKIKWFEIFIQCILFKFNRAIYLVVIGANFQCNQFDKKHSLNCHTKSGTGSLIEWKLTQMRTFLLKLTRDQFHANKKKTMNNTCSDNAFIVITFFSSKVITLSGFYCLWCNMAKSVLLAILNFMKMTDCQPSF